ncbi:transposase [Candidatus Enterovibrio escicola]|uniref:transposase n=1 Tax=Candidatus Enterovibrio escicola TaxID=1927127 RepID=UPI001237C276|nr:transposase [Candidatus Enterovibrio escacola]
MNVPLKFPTHTCISNFSKSVKVKCHLPSLGAIANVVINATGLKVYDEGEWKTRKHGKEKRCIWRKLNFAVDVFTHEVIAAEVSLVFVGDNEVLPIWLNP